MIKYYYKYFSGYLNIIKILFYINNNIINFLINLIITKYVN